MSVRYSVALHRWIVRDAKSGRLLMHFGRRVSAMRFAGRDV